MLIQNTSNIAQAPQPAKQASDGLPSVAVAIASSPQTKPSAPVELPEIAAKKVAEQHASTAQLQNALESINKALRQSSKNLEFSVDEGSRRQIVKVVDTETGDVIRQFPSEEMLAISRSIDMIQQGLLFKQEA